MVNFEILVSKTKYKIKEIQGRKGCFGSQLEGAVHMTVGIIGDIGHDVPKVRKQ